MIFLDEIFIFVYISKFLIKLKLTLNTYENIPIIRAQCADILQGHIMRLMILRAFILITFYWC